MRHTAYSSYSVITALAALGVFFTAPVFSQSGAIGAALGEVSINFSFKRQNVIASNQIAVWIEHESGAIIKTLYISRFTGKGGFSDRPDSLLAWTAKAKPSSSAALDAFTGATPKNGALTYVWDCTDDKGNPVPAGTYRYCVEGTLYLKSNALFKGIISLGKNADSSRATAVYSSDDPAHRAMLQQVQAVFTPKR
ncbi:MAG: DUF2271 domain-containing protein [Treponema sp.]|jgi:hypothetical protein|nr:DUF2271 domain-containing protein [Treponema sp.]